MNAQYTTDWANEVPVEIPMTPREKALRDWFIREYLVDYSYTGAAVRVGFADSIAVEYGQKFRYDPYVQRKLAEYCGRCADDPEYEAVQRKRRILTSLMKEANYHGPGASHGARVSALSKLAAIEGMEAPTKTESKVTHEGEMTVKHDFDFGSLSKEELGLVRQLLTKRAENADQRTES